MSPTQNLLDPSATVPKTFREPARSPRWPHVRALFLAQSPRCAACAPGLARSAHSLNVHHVVPFNFVVRVGRPDLELDPRNLLTLCEGGEDHHLVLGHLRDWESYNVHVRDDVTRPDCRGRASAEIEKLAWWTEERAKRPAHCARMSSEEQARLRAALDAVYPPAR